MEWMNGQTTSTFSSFLTEDGWPVPGGGGSINLHSTAWHSEIFSKCQINSACRTVEFKCHPYVLPVTSRGVVSKSHLIKKMARTDKEMLYLDRQVRKADSKIQLLERQRRWVHCQRRNLLIVWTKLQILTVAFVLIGNKEDRMKCELFVFIWRVVSIRKVIAADDMSYSPSVLDICRVDGMVILRVIKLYGEVLLSSNSGNIMENNICHYDVTCPLCPEFTQTLEPGFENANSHLSPGSSPAVGPIETLLGARLSVRVRGQ